MNLSEKELRTVLAVLDELMHKPYSELNTFLGSLTIDEMAALYWKVYGHFRPTDWEYDDETELDELIIESWESED